MYGAKIHLADPLYIEPIKENRFCELVHKELERRTLNTKKEALKLVATSMNELDIPYYYGHQVVCKALKVQPSPITSLIAALRLNGYSASRTQFSDTAFKTDAGLEELKTVLNEL